MVLNIELLKTNLKPVFWIKIPGFAKPLEALIDTGSTKTIWCSAKYTLSHCAFVNTGETTILSGFGLVNQTGCLIYKGNFNIYRDGIGVAFRGIDVVEAKKQTLAFDMILPYTLFRRFEYTFKPTTADAKYGKLVIDTLGNKVIYGVKSSGGVVIDTYAEDEAEVQANKSVKGEEQDELVCRIDKIVQELKEKSARQILDEQV